jgi:hydroxymethylpyrimidine pyrophosphatase-like HAD family hydrolase
VYSTGRPLGSVLQLIDNGVIKKPTALVCAEGTEIYWFDNYTSGSKPKLDEVMFRV